MLRINVSGAVYVYVVGDTKLGNLMIINLYNKPVQYAMQIPNP